VAYDGDDYSWVTEKELPTTIGRLSAFMGNASILMRAYIYAKMLGNDGMARIAEFSTLNANYLMTRLDEAGFEMAFKNRRATHEFIVTLKQVAKTMGVNTMDFAKRMLDYGVHAPTTYFPLLIAECLLIEPTETETRETLDDFVEVLKKILKEAEHTPDLVTQAPHTLPVKRLDDVRAVRQLDVAWKEGEES